MPRRNTKPAKHQPFSLVDTCSEKRRYANEKEAQNAAETLMLQNMALELHVYQCPRCHGWHLTRSSETIYNI